MPIGDNLAWRDQADAWVTECVRTYGVYIQYVGGGACAVPGCSCDDDDQPPFAYTVGLFGLNHPELVTVGLSIETSAGVLNHVARRVMDGQHLIPGALLGFDQWPHRVVPEVLPNPGEILFTANSYYQRPDHASVPALQLSYDDEAGRFPWEAGYAAPAMQPRPGTWSA
jgi:hypothetical protein